MTDINKIVAILKKETKSMTTPIVTALAKEHNNETAFKVLISTILSLRTKDEVTKEASLRLFATAKTAQEILKLKASTIAKLIYPVGFYKTKAQNILSVCQTLIEKYQNQVPQDLDALTEFKGVGRKTANLVLSLGWGLPAICVDTHVHRILNRIGYVKTKMPDETESVLRRILPKKHWIIINDLLVMYGQNLCRPISPFCSKCKIKPYCKQIGVTSKR